VGARLFLCDLRGPGSSEGSLTSAFIGKTSSSRMITPGPLATFVVERSETPPTINHNPAFIPVTSHVEGFQLVEMYYPLLDPGVASSGPTVLDPIN